MDKRIVMKIAGIESVLFSILIVIKMSGLYLGTPYLGHPLVGGGEEVAITTTIEALTPLIFGGFLHDLVQSQLNKVDRVAGIIGWERSIDVITSFLPLAVALLMLAGNWLVYSVVAGFHPWWIAWLVACVIVVIFATLEDVIPTIRTMW